MAYGTTSDEGLIIPGEAVTFLKVWMHQLARLDERQAIATHRGQHEIARAVMREYANVERKITTYVEALGPRLYQPPSPPLTAPLEGTQRL